MPKSAPRHFVKPRTPVDLRALHMVPRIVLLVDADGVILFGNHAAESWLGVSLAKPRPLSDLIAPQAPLWKILRNATEQGTELREHQHEIPFIKGERRRVDIQIIPCAYTNSGVPSELMLMMEDHAARRPANRAAALEGSSRQAGLMAAMLAHEIKNPLAAIRGAAQLLEQESPDDQQPMARLVINEADRIKSLLSETDFFYDDSPCEKQDVNIHEVLHYAWSVVEKSQPKRIRLEEQYDPSLPPVAGNHGQLVQLFVNLMKNAAEAMKETPAPHLKLSTRYDRFGGLRKGTPQVAVTVEDNGPGIPEALRDSIFAPFVSAKPGNKGLGLAIALKILEKNGGSIELEEAAAGKTRFKISLPVCR